jgi:hypothetical protein
MRLHNSMLLGHFPDTMVGCADSGTAKYSARFSKKSLDYIENGAAYRIRTYDPRITNAYNTQYNQ